ncbi:MAG: YhbY family RNA-binding protein [Treponema sp.]|jgi:RNA-binding protein|nr:YhbY family RNA-binding protein [Treponema sp.]
MIALTSRQRGLLCKYANDLKPVIWIGQKGITESLERKTDQSLTFHELIKIKFLDFKEDKTELSQSLADKCGAEVVRIIGNIVILYRPADKEHNGSYTIG